ncbi:MAG: hypothetical protein MI924_28275 [Chloroflexales bacterium]|nr:hypothetical protein [Chloroflexales bacterium]
MTETTINIGSLVIIPRSRLTEANQPYLESGVVEAVEGDVIVVDVLSFDPLQRAVCNERLLTTIEAAAAGTAYFYQGVPIDSDDLNRYIAQTQPVQKVRLARSDYS